MTTTENQQTANKSKSSFRRYWWISLGFIVPFLAVGGFWAVLGWGHVIDDAGRDGIEMDAFAPEAMTAFWNGFTEFGILAGIVGLLVVGLATYSYRFFKKTKSTDN